MPESSESRVGKLNLIRNIVMSRCSKAAKKSDPAAAADSAALSSLRPILSVEFTEDIPLTKVYVGILKEKRDISRAIQSISSPSVGLGHLKRCSGFRLLLSRVDDVASAEELKRTLTAGGFDLALLEDVFEILEVPSKPSRTKNQAETCGKIWPINFHPDPTTESIISGDVFTGDDIRAMESLMRSAVAAARLGAIGNTECNGSALIVDPESGDILALASSKIDEHPMWHAAMLAVDLVAKIQGGGAWDLVNERGGIVPIVDKGKRKFDGDLPLRYPATLNGVDIPEAGAFPVVENRQKSRPRNKREDISNAENTKTGPYLCTNFWVFMVQEPCALCAMALLHSRVSRIFYGVSTSAGFLESKAMLHTTPGLNHRYQVWAGILENECEAVCEEIKTRELKTG